MTVGDVIGAAAPDDEVEDDERDAADRAQARALLREVVGYPDLTDQQRLVILAKHFLLTNGEDDNHHATARFLGWDEKTGPAKVSVQLHRLFERIRAVQSAGGFNAA